MMIKNMKKKRFSPTGLIITAMIIAAIVLLVKHFHIKNFHIVKPEVVYVSGQPRGLDYTRLLYKYHIATIVNVRLISEHRSHNWYNEEITWAKNNGVNYIELPIVKANYFPNEKTQNQFLNIVGNKSNLPVLLHGSGDDKRVAMLTAVWMRKAQGYSTERTISEVENIMDSRRLTESEIGFIRALAK